MKRRVKRRVKRRLRVLFDVETASHGWDVRAWPLKFRLYHRRKGTTSGVEHRAGVYRFAAWEYAIEWWQAG